MPKVLVGGRIRLLAVLVLCLIWAGIASTASQPADSIDNGPISFVVNTQDGSYSIRAKGLDQPVVTARLGAQIDQQWVRSNQYPKQAAEKTPFHDELGSGQAIRVTYSGLAGKPDLTLVLRLYDNHPYGDVEVTVRNTTGKRVTIQAIRSLEAFGAGMVNLGARAVADRVISDSYSEDRPALRIYDLADVPQGMHRAVGTQLIYNRDSQQSLLLATLTSRRLLNILHLRVASSGGEPAITSYTLDSTGTTEIEEGESLKHAPAEDRIPLSLAVEPGQGFAGERVMIATGTDYHAQLEAYGAAVRILHHGRAVHENPIGWWSWNVFFGGMQEAPTLTNLRWMSQHLKDQGYTYFFLDEGYQYARGEYQTANATQFPDGLRFVGREICHEGMLFGIWTAPFEVTSRAWVYEHHKEWLVHNAQGKPIQIGSVGRNNQDALFALDTTHPGAQAYLRQTYRILTRDWGVRLIKMDFMDDSCIEGLYYRPNTTALEAQRIGLQIIREAVGEDVLLDKDGSPMLNPVGIVDLGRTSLDTLINVRDAAPGIAARYYMHNNFYTSDPDAFNVTALHASADSPTARPASSLGDAEQSIALAAVSGGMFELGDDSTLLNTQPERLALVKNPDVLQMAKLGRASFPVDLMTYRPEDQMPSVFLLKEDRRLAVLTVFNWTGNALSHTLDLAELGLSGGAYEAADIFDAGQAVDLAGGKLTLRDMAPHSVRMIKLIDSSVPAAAPTVTADVPSTAAAGALVAFSASAKPDNVPAIAYHWDFGDGTSEDGSLLKHAFTQAAQYSVRLKVEGVDGVAYEQTFPLTVSGSIKTDFDLPHNRRLEKDVF